MEFGESSSIGGKNEGGVPSDRQLISFVMCKNSDDPLSIEIPVVDLYERHPKKLPTVTDSSLGINGNGSYYYFTKRKRRDERGSRIKRSIMNEGYWKNTSKDKEIKDDKNRKIGHRKTFKFFEENDNDKKPTPTNWIMHEFRDLDTSNENSNWIEQYVLCMIYEKVKKRPTNDPPSTQAIRNTGVDAIEEERKSPIPQPHEANMDQFQEFVDDVMRIIYD